MEEMEGGVARKIKKIKQKKMMLLKRIKRAVAMPEYGAVGDMAAPMRQKTYTGTIPLNTEGPSLSRDQWTAKTIHGVMSRRGGGGGEGESMS